MIPESIPDELTPAELDKLGRELSNEVARLTKIVGTYEVAMSAAEKTHRQAFARAIVLNQEAGSATLVKAIAEESSEVIEANNVLQQASANLIMGKAELSGRDKQYQMVKKLVDLKVQELRTFRG